MIRFVAADMDGTLLDSSQRFSPELFPAIEALSARGVRFAAASGRQYYNLMERFAGLDADMMFISENGAIVGDSKGVLFTSEIPYAMLEDAVHTVRGIANAFVILCGVQGAYYESTNSVLLEHAAMYYAKREYVPDVLEKAKQDTICKIAVFEHKTIETGAYPCLKPLDGKFQVSLSGDSWVDLMMPETNKGSALRRIQAEMGITAEECMVFGDYLNDYELFQAAEHSYAMENAHPALKKISRYTAPSNDDDGVVKILQREFGLKD